MFNYGLILKILEISNETEKNIRAIMINLSNMIAEKFKIKLLINIAENTPTESQMEELINILEIDEEVTEESITRFAKWAEGTTFDFDKFMDEFENELHAIELEIMERVTKTLTDKQKREIIDFLQEQIEKERELEEEAIDATADAFLKKLTTNQ